MRIRDEKRQQLKQVTTMIIYLLLAMFCISVIGIVWAIGNPQVIIIKIAVTIAICTFAVLAVKEATHLIITDDDDD